MSLDGLRAWIGEVERKLSVRSRVFLVLVAIAIGGAGAGIYLALDAREDAVGEGDLQALQERVETQTDAGALGEEPDLATLEAELQALRDELDQLRGESEKSAPAPEGDGTSNQGRGDKNEAGSASEPDAGLRGGSAGAGVGAGADGAAKLKELVEEAQGDAK